MGICNVIEATQKHKIEIPDVLKKGLLSHEHWCITVFNIVFVLLLHHIYLTAIATLQIRSDRTCMSCVSL